MFVDKEKILMQSMINAFNQSMAMIEFSPQGEILGANENFLQITGLALEEIKGKSYSAFCQAQDENTPKNHAIWSDLAIGKAQNQGFKCIGKNGKTLWFEGFYNPVRDEKGNVIKIINIAFDISDLKAQSLDTNAKIDALNRVQAVIEFSPYGIIIDANDNFLKILGYNLDEITGQHHRIFCDPEYAQSNEYNDFWQELRSGHYHSSQYKRLGKDGREIYIQASYNPVFDDNGVVIRVIKFATNITENVKKQHSEQQLNRDLGQVIVEVNNASNMTEKASNAATQTGAIIQSVAAAAEELSQSVKEISRNMNAVKDNVENVFSSAASANQSADLLNNSAASMSGIIIMIEEIAQEINMLALNATIESARAGAAGRGFAVVAAEVKNLANQTTASTQTISAEIDKMQHISREVVGALGVISASMNDVLRNVALVATAISEQDSVTGNISQNMQSAVGAIGEITHNIDEITCAFRQVATASEKIAQSA